MANEAVLVLKLDPAIDFTVADGTGIEKGALLKLTDPRTASSANGNADVIAGIAAREKIANDGRTQIGCYRRGIFRMYASGAIAAGTAVTSIATYTNFVTQAGVTASGACIIGHALQTAANGQAFEVYVNVGSGGNQIS